MFVSLNETGNFSPPKIELRGVEELTRYVIAIFLCFLLAFAMGGLLVLLVTISEQVLHWIAFCADTVRNGGAERYII